MLSIQAFVIIFVASVVNGRAAVVNITKLADSDDNYDRNITRIPFYPQKDQEDTTNHPDDIIEGKNWKDNDHIDNLIDWEAPDYIKEKFIYYQSGYDFDSRPIIITETGKHNWREVIDQGGEPEKNLIRFWHQFLSRLELWAASKKGGDGEDGIVLILDFEGFQLNHFNSRASARFLLHRMEELGTLHDKIAYGYVINVNFAGETFINLAKPFLGSVVENFEFYGTRSEKWIPRLLRRIPQDQLPEWYGGAKNFKPIAVFG